MGNLGTVLVETWRCWDHRGGQAVAHYYIQDHQGNIRRIIGTGF